MGQFLKNLQKIGKNGDKNMYLMEKFHYKKVGKSGTLFKTYQKIGKNGTVFLKIEKSRKKWDSFDKNTPKIRKKWGSFERCETVPL